MCHTQGLAPCCPAVNPAAYLRQCGRPHKAPPLSCTPGTPPSCGAQPDSRRAQGTRDMAGSWAEGGERFCHVFGRCSACHGMKLNNISVLNNQFSTTRSNRPGQWTAASEDRVCTHVWTQPVIKSLPEPTALSEEVLHALHAVWALCALQLH